MKSEKKNRSRQVSRDEEHAARDQVTESETSVSSGFVTDSEQQPKMQNTKLVNEDIPYVNLEAEPLEKPSKPSILDQTGGRKSTVAEPDVKFQVKIKHSKQINNKVPLIDFKMKCWEEEAAIITGGRGRKSACEFPDRNLFSKPYTYY